MARAFFLCSPNCMASNHARCCPPPSPSLQISATVRTKDGSTALHYGSAFGQTHVLAALVEAGCPVDSRDNALNTPLHLASGCGFLDTVAALVDLGADVNCRDITDCTPLQVRTEGRERKGGKGAAAGQPVAC